MGERMKEPRNGLFVEYCAKDFLDGTQNLDVWEELVYRRLVDLIYSTNDRLMDDNKKLAWMTKAGPRWPKIKAVLIEAGKIEVFEGRITNARCQKELEKSAKKIEQKRIAGKASADARSDARKCPENKETTPTAVGTAVPTAVPTADPTAGQLTSNPLNQESKKDTGAKAPGAIAANELQISPAVVIDLFLDAEQTPAQMMWGTYLHELATMTGKSTKDANLRKLLGQWSKAYGGEQAVCEAISDASARQPPLADPVPWIIATLKTRSNSNGRHSKVQRERYSWHDLGRDCELFEGSA